MDNNVSKNAKWYVVHTYSGYENKVKTNLDKIIENRGLEDSILDIKIPTEDVVETKGEEKKVVTRKIFPGYVLIKMRMTDETWYIVRNTTGVTGFVGEGTKPVPLTEEEVESLGVDVREVYADYSIGDNVRITEGAFVNQSGTVEAVNKETGMAKIKVAMFGRETSLELSINHIESV